MAVQLRTSRIVRAGLLGLVLALIVTACGNGDEPDATEEPTDSEEVEPEEPEETEEPEEAEEPDADPGDGEFVFEDDIVYVNTRPPGGSADLLGRLIAEALPAYLPGNPRIVVENIGDGGGAVAMQNVTSVRDPEDIVMTHVTGGVMLRWVLGADGHDYPLETMLMVGGLPLALVTAVSTDIADIEQLAEGGAPVQFGAASPGSTGGLLNFLVGELFEMDYDQAFGLDGEAGVILAMEQGELSAGTIVDSLYLESVEGLGWAEGIMQTGLAGPDGVAGFERSPNLPDIPTYAEEYERIFGELPSGPVWDALAAVASVSSSQQAVMMPAGTPDEALEALQAGFEEMIATESWMELTRAVTGAPVAGLGADGATEALNALTGLDDETIAILQQASED